MKLNFQYICLVFALAFCFSCKKENMCDCLKSTGDIITKDIEVTAFTSIEVQSNVNVYITQDTVCSVRVEAGKHLMKSITAQVSNGMLTLDNNNRCNFMRSYKKPINIYVRVKDLSELVHRGSGQVISTNTIKQNMFTANVWSSGNIELLLDLNDASFNLHVNSGDMTLRGISGVSRVYSAGNGIVNAGELVTGYTYLNNKSTGDIYVNVTKEFYPQINWTGNVYYSGNPPLVQPGPLNGKGKLIAY